MLPCYVDKIEIMLGMQTLQALLVVDHVLFLLWDQVLSLCLLSQGLSFLKQSNKRSSIAKSGINGFKALGQYEQY